MAEPTTEEERDIAFVMRAASNFSEQAALLVHPDAIAIGLINAGIQQGIKSAGVAETEQYLRDAAEQIEREASHG